MSRRSSVTAALVLGCYLAGCTTYRTIDLVPPDDTTGSAAEPSSTSVAAGDELRVTLADSTVIEGSFRTWQADAITLHVPATGLAGARDCTIPLHEITTIEKKGRDGTSTAIAGVVGGIVFLAAIGAIVFAATYEDPWGSGGGY
jgi:hypothetical protein